MQVSVACFIDRHQWHHGIFLWGFLWKNTFDQAFSKEDLGRIYWGIRDNSSLSLSREILLTLWHVQVGFRINFWCVNSTNVEHYKQVWSKQIKPCYNVFDLSGTCCLQLAYVMGQSEWLTCPRKVILSLLKWNILGRVCHLACIFILEFCTCQIFKVL